MSNADPQTPRVVRRRRGPFKRSRTGCGTCKRRGKKCDEIWSPEGFCQRCLAGPWECTGRSPAPASSASASAHSQGPRRVDNEMASAGQAQHAMGLPLGGNGLGGLMTMPLGMGPVSVNSLASGVSSGAVSVNGTLSPRGPTPTPAHVSPTLPIQGNSLPSGSSPSAAGLSVPGVMTNIHGVMAAASTLNGPGGTAGGEGVGYFTDVYNGVMGRPLQAPQPTQAGRSSSRGPVPTPQHQIPHPLFEWPSAGGSGLPSAMIATADGALAIETAHYPSSTSTSTSNGLGDVQEFWSDLSASFTGVGPLTPASRGLFLSSDKPMRQGVSLAEIYARVVESWMVGMSGPTREYARERILALPDSNSVIRGVRYAVAAAYIFLFAHDPHAHPRGEKEPKPKLVELACRGAGIVAGARPGPGASPGTGAVKKLRFYVDHVSTPFAGDIESTKWTEDAVAELRRVVVTDRHQLSELLWGVIDLQLVEFIRGGAAPSYNMLDMGVRLVRSAFGAEQPRVSLSDLRTSETFSLRLFGLSDISRCIVQRGRRTLFAFETENDAAPMTREDETWSTYLGLPDAIAILLADIVNLCADAPTLPCERVQERASEIESALRGWTGTLAPGVEASALMSRTIAGEMWRLSSLVLLYQSVHGVGPLHPVLRDARVELLALLASVTQLPNGDLWGFIALPSFLAATLSIDQVDRDKALTFMVRAGPERVWLDNIALVEKVWEEMDETGRPVDWREKMVREGLSIAFF